MAGDTRKLDQHQRSNATANPGLTPLDRGMPRPWKIALRIEDIGLQLVFDIAGSMVVGRANPESGISPDINLGPFNAKEKGVSREHLFLNLDNNRVVVIDNNSINGTRLNGEFLKAMEAYPVRNGDVLALGEMVLKVELLINPYA